MQVKIKKLANLQDLPLPAYSTGNSSGQDLRAAFEMDKIVIQPGEIVKIPTGIALNLPYGYEGQIRPRSGLSSKGILIHFGTIDRDYIGECIVVAQNLSPKEFIVERGNRIAQLVISPIEHFEWQVVEELSPTSRGDKGLGSSGVK